MATNYIKIAVSFERSEDGKKKLIVGDFRSPAIEYLKDLSFEWTEKIDGNVH